MSHMPNLSFINAPEIALLTLTKGDLLLQAGLSGPLQHLALKHNFKYDSYFSEDHHVAALPPLLPILSLC